jgi:hypothetical protein
LANKLTLSLDRIERKNLDIASRVYFDKVFQGIAFDADHIIEGKALLNTNLIILENYPQICLG